MIDEIIHGDALDVLSTIPDNTVDSIVTDPPSSIKFMGKTWDNDKGGVDGWITWLSGVMHEAMRTLKPGGHAYIWALPRTSYMTGYALHKAGFEIRDCVVHLFGTGFPKSHNISKAIDAHFKAEREVIGKRIDGRYAYDFSPASQKSGGIMGNQGKETKQGGIITAPATPEALAHEGEGTALKPASEHWWLCRKPLSEPTIAENVLRWGVGGLNIDKTRINVAENDSNKRQATGDNGGATSIFGVGNHKRPATLKQGRWPANVIMSHSLFCVPRGVKQVKGNGGGWNGLGSTHDETQWRLNNPDGINRQNQDGLETIEDWECSDDCPIKMLGQQSGNSKSKANAKNDYRSQWGGTVALEGGMKSIGIHTPENSYTDEGGASRYFNTFSPDPEPFFYVAKPSRREKNAGLEGLPQREATTYHDESIEGAASRGRQPRHSTPTANTHPTVKSLALTKHLIKQVTPAGGIVLDCFAGSGSTLVACIHEGYHFIGIEQADTSDEPYVTIARSRIAHALASVDASPQHSHGLPLTRQSSGKTADIARQRLETIQPFLFTNEIAQQAILTEHDTAS